MVAPFNYLFVNGLWLIYSQVMGNFFFFFLISKCVSKNLYNLYIYYIIKKKKKKIKVIIPLKSAFYVPTFEF